MGRRGLEPLTPCACTDLHVHTVRWIILECAAVPWSQEPNLLRHKGLAVHGVRSRRPQPAQFYAVGPWRPTETWLRSWLRRDHPSIPVAQRLWPRGRHTRQCRRVAAERSRHRGRKNNTRMLQLRWVRMGARIPPLARRSRAKTLPMTTAAATSATFNVAMVTTP